MGNQERESDQPGIGLSVNQDRKGKVNYVAINPQFFTSGALKEILTHQIYNKEERVIRIVTKDYGRFYIAQRFPRIETQSLSGYGLRSYIRRVTGEMQSAFRVVIDRKKV